MTNDMLKTQLTAEESAKLIELGVSPKRASESKYNRYYQRYNPIFTLTDILEILPKEIDGEHLEMGADDEEWYAEYNDITLTGSYSFAPELIDALYSLLVWCMEKGYVK